MENQEYYFEENPWIVESLEHFLYYCCPECQHNLKFTSRESFLQHAINQHPLVQKCLPILTGVKEECDGNKVPIIYFFDGRSPSRHKQSFFI